MKYLQKLWQKFTLAYLPESSPHHVTKIVFNTEKYGKIEFDTKDIQILKELIQEKRNATSN
jgi:hypothetical protein